MLFSRKKYPDCSDEELMRLLADGDEQAFGNLYDRYAGKMYSYFYRMLNRDGGRAEDFTQEIFMKIIEKPHLFDTGQKFKTWLYVVAGNLCKNEYRRASRKPLELGLPDDDGYFTEMNLPEKIDQGFFERELDFAVAELDAPQKECFLLRYREELSIREISDIMGIPEGTVKSRLFYALKKLACRLREFNPL